MPEAARRVVLVGFMGAGKTTVGRLLAERLGWRFEDMDRRIEKRTGREISVIFREGGEEVFREEERREAVALSALDRCVVAAGGGAFTRPETREALRRGAVTVWLRVDLDAALARLPSDGRRPLAGNRAIMRGLLTEREPLYRLADVTVDASSGNPREVADRVAALLAGRVARERPKR